MLKGFEGIFTNELSEVLLSKYDVDHKIELVPGAESSNKMLYRLKQQELAELKH